MDCYSSTLKALPLTARDSRSIQLFTLPQWNIFMCRARWIVTPHPSDEGSGPLPEECSRWAGAAKSFFWLAAAIAFGLLMAGLSG